MATATDVPMIAMASVTGTPTRLTTSAGNSNNPTANSTPIVGLGIPRPVPGNAGTGSPLSTTQPLTPGVALQVKDVPPPDPGLLPVITPVAHTTDARQILAGYGFGPQQIGASGAGTSSTTATVILSGHRVYRVTLLAQSYGYHLTLKLLTAIPQNPGAPATSFDPKSSARAFLLHHYLTTDLGKDTVSQVGSDTVITFTTTLSNTYQVAGMGTTLTYTRAGALKAADIHLVDDSSPPLYTGLSASAALAEVARGNGLAAVAGGASLDSTASVTSTAILYVPVTDGGASYLEPVYRFSGVTGSGAPFDVYVPAVDQSYLQ